ncbi:hypothetical protein C1645_834097 [Glomus cerebriforme]|uniref:Uncharacterized protein n=1 Tax=Glomus cerebriforme TaxID=658196 RepID=A0A397SKA0_9GLOM|nr:hypothetical protein C1645_834097 [Glomus cerebriforme]
MSLFSSEIPMEESTDTTIYTIPEPLELSIGCYFDTWIVAENTIKEYGKHKRFAINRHQVEYSKNQITNLENPIEQQHNKGSKKTDCKWHVNLSKHIIFIHPDYNHKLLANNVIFATTFQRFDISIMKEIEHAIMYDCCDVYTIQNLLQPLFPDQLFLTQDLLNAI